MFSVIRRILAYKFFPFCWTLLIITLLCIPGSYVPGTGIFGMPHLDKVVHIFLFGFNVLFWGWHYQGNGNVLKIKTIYLITALLTIALGIVMEFVQMYFIPNRSFDGWDIVADVAGAVLAWLWLMRA